MVIVATSLPGLIIPNSSYSDVISPSDGMVLNALVIECLFVALLYSTLKKQQKKFSKLELASITLILNSTFFYTLFVALPKALTTDNDYTDIITAVLVVALACVSIFRLKDYSPKADAILIRYYGSLGIGICGAVLLMVAVMIQDKGMLDLFAAIYLLKVVFSSLIPTR